MNRNSFLGLALLALLFAFPFHFAGAHGGTNALLTISEGDCSVPTSQRIAIQNATAAFIEVEFSVVANATVSLTPTVCDGSFAAEGIVTIDLDELRSSYSWRYDGGILIMDNINI